MPVLIVQGGEYRNETIEISGGRLILGRSVEADLILKSSAVSTKHAQVVQRGEAFWLQDLGSTNGTFIEDSKIIQQILSNGAQFVIGPYNLTFAESEEEFRTEQSESLEEILRSLHGELIARLNLKQISVEQMHDAALRDRASKTLDSLLEERRKELPSEFNRQDLKKSVLDAALGLGPLEDLLKDKSVTEIMVNGPEQIYIERDGKLQLSRTHFLGKTEIMTAIERIVGPIGRRIDESSPLVDARLADGSRVNAIIPPLALDSPLITIRKFPDRRMTIEDLLGFKAMSSAMAEFLRLCVVTAKNMVISGGTGSGKTTLLNVLGSFIPDGARIVTIEDSAELNLPQDHVARLETRPANIEGKGEFTIRDLVKNALRMRPDRIVVGECRGGEALDMIQAMNTGHDGSLTTAHANSPPDCLRRIETMVMMAGMDLPLRSVRDNVHSAVDIIVQISRFSDGTRKVTSIAELGEMYEGEIQVQEMFKYVKTGVSEEGKVLGNFMATGIIPHFVEELQEAGIGVDMSIFVPKEPDE